MSKINMTMSGGNSALDMNMNPKQSGTGSTSNYELLDNKPKINDVELVGNKTAKQLGLVDEATYKALEEIVAKKLNDILVNGASIKDENGNANIPIANRNKVGLVKTDAYLGLTIESTTGNIGLYKCTNGHIDERNSSAFAINTTNYDRAVKNHLTDGKAPEYTSEEKASARERLGIDTYELITDITTEEEVSKINIELLKDYKSLKFYFIVPKVASANGIRIVNNSVNIGFAPSNNVSTSATRHILIDIDVYSGYGTVSISKYGTSAMAVGSPNSNYNDRDTLINENVEVFLGNIGFPTGTNIKVWGDK